MEPSKDIKSIEKHVFLIYVLTVTSGASRFSMQLYELFLLLASKAVISCGSPHERTMAFRVYEAPHPGPVGTRSPPVG